MGQQRPRADRARDRRPDMTEFAYLAQLAEIIDDFASLEMDAAQAKLAFQVISERYDYRRSTCITKPPSTATGWMRWMRSWMRSAIWSALTKELPSV